MANMPNYYANPYMNYGQFSNMPNYSFNPQTMHQPSLSQITQPTTLPQSNFGQNNTSMISGKIVESVEMSKIQEVIPGGYGVFPLADFSKVIIKAYDKEGNLQYLTYDLVKPEETVKEDIYANKLTDIYEYLGKLDKKIDGIKVPASTLPKKKRLDDEEVDDYE